ncbi:acetate uptake transporter [Klebsiella pneumoniae]|uniref:Acetate uptake transporter n=1 Tax=Klebsiella pneumoniae TaxID=573 RepID=A0A939NUB9_KLEPN|nr:acetate uptake transporter [Klebsiella pneumoniae]
MGFGMTTILLNPANSGLFAFDVAITAMGIFTAALRKFCRPAGIQKGNTFGLTAFTSYGSFWLTLVAILLMPKMGGRRAKRALPRYVPRPVGRLYLFMFFGTLKAARMLQFVFLSLTVLFALLAIGHLADNEGIVKVAGWVGSVCGASAIYPAMGEVLNEQFGRTVLPIGEPR